MSICAHSYGSIPIKEKDAKVAMALAKLYHHYKNERFQINYFNGYFNIVYYVCSRTYIHPSRCAIICYKQARYKINVLIIPLWSRGSLFVLSSMNPLAVEGALGLFSLGVSLTEVLKSTPTTADRG